MSVELTETLMVALGSLFESLSCKDVQAIGDMYTTTPSEETVADATEGVPEVPSIPAKQRSCPPVLDKAGGNEAVLHIEKGTLSSPRKFVH